MEEQKGSEGIYAQIKKDYNYPPREPLTIKMIMDCLEALDKRDQEYRKNNPPVMELPMVYALELSCEQLKAHVDSKHNYRFIGGSDAYTKLTKKCDDCGIKY